jgi:eukaryotic-like serine/threonine-protein kinase
VRRPVDPKWRQASFGISQPVPSTRQQLPAELARTTRDELPADTVFDPRGPGAIEMPALGTIANGRFVLTRELGRGGMGVVYEARDTENDQPVAVKVLAADPSNSEALGRFVMEARVAACIPHENIARTFDLGVDRKSGCPYMVMELLRGQDLDTMLQARGPLPIEEACGYVMQACSGLAAAHRLNVVHRDVKLSNLFVIEVDGRRIVKVLDFGVSKAPSFSDMTRLTATGTTVGSPVYMAPEQVRSARTVDARADVWSIGVVLYELLTGTPPFDGETIPDLFAKILQQEPKPVRQLRPDVPGQLELLVNITLQKERDKRYASIETLQRELAPHAGLAAGVVRRGNTKPMR